MGWNDHVDFESEDRIEWIVENGYIDDRPEYDFLRKIVADRTHILAEGCYRDPEYQEMFGLAALSQEQWRMAEALIDQTAEDYREEFGCEVCSHDEGERICTGLCTAEEDQALVEKQREELHAKVMALLPRECGEVEQHAVEQIVDALTHIVIGDAWATGFYPFRRIGEVVKPLVELGRLPEVGI